MLSILIPTYNYNVYNLVKELHSQMDGILLPLEIIVLDDCSNTFKAENECINSLTNVRYIFSEENVGRTANRAKLTELSNYDWLLFLDSDVMPKDANFLGTYISYIQKTTNDAVFGGIVYQEERPRKEQLLRWHYGREREAKPVYIRQKTPYFVISQNLLIKKNTFQAVNTIKENYYGLDNIFSNQLKKQKVKVGHIDNPVVHLGLENNDTFVSKALKAVKTTVLFEERELMDRAERPLQKSYLKLKRLRLTKLFSFLVSKFKGKMERNFVSEKPNLFWFDLYRLAYYIELKNGNNA